MSDDLGTRLDSALADRYRIEGELDRGGMAIVYVAQDLRHDRKVAVKVLQPIVAETVGTDRFLREVDLVARLQHPHVLTLIESGEADGLPYYVMPLVKGQSLAKRLASEGPLPVEEAVRIGREIADALGYAHAHGVIHRDIKPANVLLSEGHAVVADFGIAGALEYAATNRLTQTGVSLGSPVYMSPEQASGDVEIDHRTDIYSLGCVIFEMLAGQTPFEGSSMQAVLTRKVLGDIPPVRDLRPEAPTALDSVLSKAMAQAPSDRYGRAEELGDALRQAVAGVGAVPPAVRRRRRVLMGSLLAAGLATILLLGSAFQQSRTAVRLAQQFDELERLLDVGDLSQALLVGRELEAAVPGDSTLSTLLPRFSFTMPLRSDPPGARVYVQDATAPGDDWELIGETPIESVRFAEGEGYRLRFEADGRVPLEFLEMPFRVDEWMNYPPLDPVKLPTPGELPEGMVRVPGFPIEVDGQTVQVGEYLMDTHEVTNRRFKEFVDAGGYEDASYWTGPFMDGDSELEFSEAIARFRDRSGRPGPATWELGSYPQGEADYPVGGLSWYEAEAYARFVEKELPTTIHWSRAIRFWREVSWVMAAGSNLGGDGPQPVGQASSMGPFGIFDQVGNVREWCWNVVAEGRAARGGAWNDPPFMTMHVLPKGAWDRDPTHGFRLAKTFDPDEIREALRRPIDATRLRDYRYEVPVSDTEYEIFRRLYAYDPVPLEPRREAADTFEHWVRELVTFDLPYGERGGAYLYLPHEAARPLQTVLYWGGADVVNTNSPDEEYLQAFDFVIRSGRAVAQPVWQGSFWRDDENHSTTFGTYFSQSDRPSFRAVQIQWMQDLSTTLDYVETRDDLDAERIGFYGFSWGGQAAPIALAVEDRLKAAVLNVGGLWPNYQFIPEADPLNFAPHVYAPVLMINGEFDNVFPLETGQKPLYELLGTAPEHKRHHVTERAHLVPRDVLYREAVGWFDRYLGPLRR